MDLKIMKYFYQNHNNLNSKKFIIFLFSVFIFLLFISCSDLQKESASASCNKALDEKNWDTAIKECTSSDQSKQLGDAWMGKGGFYISNLLNVPLNKICKEYSLLKSKKVLK